MPISKAAQTHSNATDSYSAKFNEELQVIEANPHYRVPLAGKKSEYWNLAVKEWAEHEGIICSQKTVLSSEGEWTHYEFLARASANAFIVEVKKRSFDVEAKEIERRAAGIKLEQAESPIAWAPSPERAN